jgi:hypothetical protein
MICHSEITAGLRLHARVVSHVQRVWLDPETTGGERGPIEKQHFKGHATSRNRRHPPPVPPGGD